MCNLPATSRDLIGVWTASKMPCTCRLGSSDPVLTGDSNVRVPHLSQVDGSNAQRFAQRVWNIYLKSNLGLELCCLLQRVVIVAQCRFGPTQHYVRQGMPGNSIMSASLSPEPFLTSIVDDNESVRKFLRELIDLGLSFKASPHVFPGEMEASPDQVDFAAMPAAGLPLQKLLTCFFDIAQQSSNWASPNFLGFPDAANNIAGLAAALFVPLLNQNMANQEICSPRATFIEMEVLHWLRESLGYQLPKSYHSAAHVGGVSTLGGCLSNTIALLAAREKLFPGSGLQGLPLLPARIRVLVPDIVEHYSIRSAMAWLSLGEQNVLRVPIIGFRIDQNALKRTITQERERGNHILACVAYAGDSRSMQVDDLDGLADILRQARIWFHVDACHGSQLAFSEKHKSKLRGIEKADSVTIDPHKTMGIPYSCSFVLFRDPSTLAATSTNSDLILNTKWSLGRITPFMGSRAFDSLKLWSVIKFLGKEGLARLIDERLELTRCVQLEIEQRSSLVLMNFTDINSCMLLFLPVKMQDYCKRQRTRLSDADLEKLNGINSQIRERICRAGKFYVHGFCMKSFPDEHFIDAGKRIYLLRIMNGNPLSTISCVRGLLDDIARLGEELFDQTKYRIAGPEPSGSYLQRLHAVLDSRLRSIFGGRQYIAVVYGSTTVCSSALLSDIDLMIFSDHAESALSKELEAMFRSIMGDWGILIDAEVPFERKLLVSLETASKAARLGPPLDNAGRVLSISKTAEYLSSDEMLQRLIFNVLTTPTQIISSTATLEPNLQRLEKLAADELVKVIRRINRGKVDTADEFVNFAKSDGLRSGEAYLGYKSRSNVESKLRHIFNHASNVGV